MAELLSLRTINSKTFDLGNGQRRLSVSQGVIHYPDFLGQWHDCDENYSEPDGLDGFSSKFTKILGVVRIKDDGTRRIYPDRNDLSYYIDIGKPFPSMGLPTKTGNTWKWDFPNASITVKMQVGSVKFNAVLKNASAPTSITIPFSTTGITRTGNKLYHNGELVGELVKPFATDASSGPGGMLKNYFPVDVTWNAVSLTLSIDPTGMVYPIDIDPTLNIQPGSKSVYNQESTPTTNRYNAIEGVVVYTQSGGASRFNSCLEFSLSGLPPNSTIDSATLSLYVNSTNDAGGTVEAYKLTRTDWVATEMTWNIYKTGSNWTTAGGDYVTTNPSGSGNVTILAVGNWMNFTVTNIVQDAYSGGNPAEFFLYKTNDNGPDKGVHWWSNEQYGGDTSLRPKLDITYTTLTPLSKIHGAGISTINKINGVSVGSIVKYKGVSI